MGGRGLTGQPVRWPVAQEPMMSPGAGQRPALLRNVQSLNRVTEHVAVTLLLPHLAHDSTDHTAANCG